MKEFIQIAREIPPKQWAEGFALFAAAAILIVAAILIS